MSAWRILALVAFALGGCAEQYPLPANVAEAVKMEADDALPLTPFYDPPQPLPDAAPGTLIRTESFGEYQLPPGASAIRFLYHSRNLAGTDVAASGVILIPAGAPPTGGWPVIAWAHGTTGVARECAPSLMRDVAYGDEGLMPMVADGFAVVAPDYAGLGTPTPHQYENKMVQAYDVVYAVAAARQALPALGPKWVTIGHSQGGTAAWGVAEYEASHPDPRYAGAISVAGDMNFASMLGHDVTIDPETALYWVLEAYGLEAAYPDFEPAQWLSPAGLSLLKDSSTKGCWYYAYALAKGLGRQPMVRPDWYQGPVMQRWFADNLSETAPIRGPMLVIAGEDDHSVDFTNIDHSVHAACRNGIDLEFIHPPGLDHDPLMDKTTPMQLAWARARLGGQPWHGSCAALTG